MTANPNWYYDEKKHSGVNYSLPENVDNFDSEHTKFRDYEKEAGSIMQKVEMKEDDIVLDMGCGSGGLSLPFASRAKQVYAVDVSEEMIGLCKRKISKNHIENIIAVKSGFLDYRHEGPDIDIIISSLALHHLPDFWKFIALRKMQSLLKEGGKFYLTDVVFSLPENGYDESVSEWVDALGKIAGNNMREESIIHVKEEYSTLDWIMETMLEKAGFAMKEKEQLSPHIYGYLCLKQS